MNLNLIRQFIANSQSLCLIACFSSLSASRSYAGKEEFPLWIREPTRSDAQNYFTVCSFEALDPQEAKQKAEVACLSSAARLSDVDVEVKSKTVQSTTGVDSSESVAIKPISTNLRCEWSHEYLQQVGAGFRVWLECKVPKSALSPIQNKRPELETKNSGLKSALNINKKTITLFVSPAPDKIAVFDQDDHETIIEPTGSSTKVSYWSNSLLIEVRKLGYSTYKINPMDGHLKNVIEIQLQPE